jgi:hypothetical protein
MSRRCQRETTLLRIGRDALGLPTMKWTASCTRYSAR